MEFESKPHLVICRIQFKAYIVCFGLLLDDIYYRYQKPFFRIQEFLPSAYYEGELQYLSCIIHRPIIFFFLHPKISMAQVVRQCIVTVLRLGSTKVCKIPSVNRLSGHRYVFFFLHIQCVSLGKEIYQNVTFKGTYYIDINSRGGEGSPKVDKWGGEGQGSPKFNLTSTMVSFCLIFLKNDYSRFYF